MLTHNRGGRAGATALLVVTALTACDERQETPLEPSFDISGNTGGQGVFEVYTQNMYLGGDTGPLFSIDFSDIPLVVASTNAFWQQVLASNVPDRAAAIVDEIDQRRPDVVALQEVLRFVLLDGGFQPIGGIDLLAAIESEIASRGLPYETGVVQEATSSTLPLAFGAGGISQWLNFTDRVVTLRRTDTELVSTDRGLYAASLNLGPVVLKRGWTRTTIRHAGTLHHFINTHLEIGQIAPIQAAQAAELQNVVVAGLEGVTIIAGDLNSNAAAAAGDPSRTPTYDDLVAAGFVDVWESAPPARRGEGLTCCHPSSLTGDQEFDQLWEARWLTGSGCAGATTRQSLSPSRSVRVNGASTTPHATLARHGISPRKSPPFWPNSRPPGSNTRAMWASSCRTR